MKPVSVVVLAGGPSSEREVSLMSGAAVSAALRSAGHLVEQSDIGPADLSALDRPGVDVVFPVLHGAWGEDGRLQRELESRGLSYVGSGPKASAMAMDKSAAKETFAAVGVPTPPGKVLRRWPGRWSMDLPVVIKPIDGGSSIGLTIARDLAAARAAVTDLCDKHGRCLVEHYVPGRELTVGVLGNRALPAIEIEVNGHEFYDYQAKYFDDGTRYVVNPPLGAALTAELSRLALAAHDALGCRDFSRVDFILDRAGRLWTLEVNTIPGFTSHSLLPKAAAAMGIDFAVLCCQLMEMALARKEAVEIER